MKNINRLNDVLQRTVSFLPVFENTLMLQFTGTWMPQRHLWPRESRGEETARAGKKQFQNYLIVSEFLEFFSDFFKTDYLFPFDSFLD